MKATNANKRSAKSGASFHQGSELDESRSNINIRADVAPPMSPMRRVDLPSSTSEPQQQQQQQQFDRPSLRERPASPNPTTTSNSPPSASTLHPRVMVQKLAGFGDAANCDKNQNNNQSSPLDGPLAENEPYFPPVAGATAVSPPVANTSSTPAARPGFDPGSKNPGSSQEGRLGPTGEGQNPLHQQNGIGVR
jgi:hypothetical protein